ncbi:MAG: cytoplasmic protein [bacterium]
MMNFIPIKVECYSGYKADEYPKFFYWNNNKFEIIEVLDRWYQANCDAQWSVATYFKVYSSCGKEYIIKHDLESDEWFLNLKHSA